MNAAGLNNRIKSMVFQNVGCHYVWSVQSTSMRSGVFNVVLDIGVERGIIFRARFKRADVYQLLVLWDHPIWDEGESYITRERLGREFDSLGETRSEPVRSVRTRFEHLAGPHRSTWEYDDKHEYMTLSYATGQGRGYSVHIDLTRNALLEMARTLEQLT